MVDSSPVPLQIDRLEVVSPHEDGRTVIEGRVRQGTYVLALARDLGRMLGCFGHVAALRRTPRRGPFTEAESCAVATLTDQGPEAALAHLRPVETALDAIPGVAVSRDMGLRLMRGQPVILRGRDAPVGGKAFRHLWRHPRRGGVRRARRAGAAPGLPPRRTAPGRA